MDLRRTKMLATIGPASDSPDMLRKLFQNGVTACLARAIEDSRSYYLLGYVPPNNRAQGKFRRLEVRATRAGVTAQTRPTRIGRSPGSSCNWPDPESYTGPRSPLQATYR